jgi:glutamyl-tRNA synthetase
MRASGRFAPSPSGAMHLGNVRTALLAWLSARSGGGRMVLRVEDLDTGRVVPGAEQNLMDELHWLGLDWDEGPDVGGPCAPYRQSERARLYEQAIARLLQGGQAFLCGCSRADVARAATAPHGEEGPRYAGTCRDKDPALVQARAAAQGRPPSVRFRGDGRRLPFDDGLHGPVDPLGADGLDDFVIRRADGTAAYQLAVVVDDAAMGITEVVRGDDLLSSTPRQLALYQALGLAAPCFVHVPLVLSPAGERLAKRTRPRALADLRAAGLPPDAVVGALAASAGLCPAGSRTRPRDLVPGFLLDRVSRKPATIELAP